MSPFDTIKLLRNKRKYELIDVMQGYTKFVINRALVQSFNRNKYDKSSLFVAVETNKFTKNITDDMHFKFLYHMLPKSSSYSTWNKKPELEEKIENIMRLYDYSREHATAVSDLIPDEVVKELSNKGGK